MYDHIIDGTRTRVAVYVNAEICRTNWYIGKRIKEDVLYNRRAGYGKCNADAEFLVRDG